ncbi:MAG: haloacid dehalogenase type II [Actinomycetota bacterium]|nr:haloacid dehalogenase type II [Actinomycetota bacterium]
MPRVCVFDVNETLLDLAALDPHFERIFGDAAVRQEWFGQMIQSALVSIVTDAYSDFGAVGGAALQMTAERHDVELSNEDRDSILTTVPKLPPHPEAEESLARLRNAGLRLATLTNSTQQVAESQMENSGLGEYFEQILSADTVQRLKPAPEPYRMAAESLGVEIGGIRMVAAHAWDIAGASRAGCATAFVYRPGKVPDPLVERPDVIGTGLSEVADGIIRAEV